MPDGDNDLTKADLLAAIRSERALLDELFSSLDSAGMLNAGRGAGWTPQDVMAHITTWEQRLLRWIDRWRATGRPERPEPGVGWDDIDTLNNRDYQSTRGKNKGAVAAEAWASYEAVLQAIEALNDDELAVRPEAVDGPSWSWIAGGNTHEHYREHREELEVWLAARRATVGGAE